MACRLGPLGPGNPCGGPVFLAMFFGAVFPQHNTMSLPFSLGAKAWSTNADDLSGFEAMYDDGYFEYVELYVVPGTEGTLARWKKATFPFVVHCPHSGHGFNLARPELRSANAEKFAEARLFLDTLGASLMVVHPGNNGDPGEAARQLKALDEPRIALENKPRLGLGDETCLGATLDHMRELLDRSGLSRTVLDFGHAIHSANVLGLDADTVIDDLASLEPVLFHLNDGHYDGRYDEHLHFGDGSFDIPRLVGRVPDGRRVTLETPRSREGGLNDLRADVEWLRREVMVRGEPR